MAELFDRDVAVISRHIKKSFNEEIEEKSNLPKMQVANSNLHLVIQKQKQPHTYWRLVFT